MKHMRAKFTQADLRLAQRIANHLSKIEITDSPWDDPAEQHSKALRQVMKKIGLSGKVRSGAFRVAIVTDRLVFKVQYTAGQKRLDKEAQFINRARSGQHSRHFPLTQVVTSKNGKFKVMIQERVRVDARMYRSLRWQVEQLGNQLGISDVHEYNYGWAGPKGKEWPVFIDVDLRLSGRRARKVKQQRSWMVAWRPSNQWTVSCQVSPQPSSS